MMESVKRHLCLGTMVQQDERQLQGENLPPGGLHGLVEWHAGNHLAKGQVSGAALDCWLSFLANLGSITWGVDSGCAAFPALVAPFAFPVRYSIEASVQTCQ